MNKRRPCPKIQERNQRILALRQEGFSLNEIAYQVNVSGQVVANVLWRNGKCKPKSMDRTSIVGRRFSRIVVLEFVGRKEDTTDTLWRCVCDCGTEKIIQRGNLVSGGTKSCGCLRKEPRRKSLETTA